jgi:hypothetical protein
MAKTTNDNLNEKFNSILKEIKPSDDNKFSEKTVILREIVDACFEDPHFAKRSYEEIDNKDFIRFVHQDFYSKHKLFKRLVDFTTYLESYARRGGNIDETSFGSYLKFCIKENEYCVANKIRKDAIRIFIFEYKGLFCDLTIDIKHETFILSVTTIDEPKEETKHVDKVKEKTDVKKESTTKTKPVEKERQKVSFDTPDTKNIISELVSISNDCEHEILDILTHSMDYRPDVHVDKAKLVDDASNVALNFKNAINYLSTFFISHKLDTNGILSVTNEILDTLYNLF